MSFSVEQPIAFFDSGVGGLPYLLNTRKKAPYEHYVYMADRENFPYGERNVEEIKSIVFEGISKLVARVNPKLIVIACNTASVVALSDLRREFTIPFVGVVPAVKPAAATCENGRIVVLATKTTTEGDYLSELIDVYANNCDVVKYPAGGIVELVERRYFNLTIDGRIEYLRGILSGLKNLGARSVVLGCTHFVLIREEIREALGGNVEIIDSTEGVSNQVVRVLKQENLLREPEGIQKFLSNSHGGIYIEGEDVKDNFGAFYLTGKPPFEESYLLFAKKYGLNFMGEI